MSQQPSRELQEVSQQLQAIQAQIEELNREQETLRATKSDIAGAIDALERLESGSTVQVPLGGSSYVKATIEEIDEVIVDIGGDFSAERTQSGAISTLKEREENVEGRIEEITEQIGELESERTELEQQAQQMSQQQQQQLGGDGPGDL